MKAYLPQTSPARIVKPTGTPLFHLFSSSFYRRSQFFILSVFCLVNACSAQNYKYVYYFDDQLVSVKKAKAIVTGKGLKEDGLFRLDYFGKEGNLFLSAHYVDSSLAVMQGEVTSYHTNGKIEKQGSYLNDEMNGSWQKWDDLGIRTDSTIYKDGKVYKEAKFDYYKNGTLRYTSFKDSLADIYTSTSYDEKGVISSEVYFKGQLGILKRYDSTGTKLDSLFTREEREASFPGGQQGWIRFLQKNLNANVPVDNGAPGGIFQVIVKFMVAPDGSISDVKAETKHGYGMEEEVIKIIKMGPAWIPAVQYGRKVNAYRRQPVTFVVEEQVQKKNRRGDN